MFKKMNKLISLTLAGALGAASFMGVYAAEATEDYTTRTEIEFFEAGEDLPSYVSSAQATVEDIYGRKGAIKVTDTSNKPVKCTLNMSEFVEDNKDGVLVHSFFFKTGAVVDVFGSPDGGSMLIAKINADGFTFPGAAENSKGTTETVKTDANGWNEVKIYINYTADKIHLFMNDDVECEYDLYNSFKEAGSDLSKLEFKAAPKSEYYIAEASASVEEIPELISEVWIGTNAKGIPISADIVKYKADVFSDVFDTMTEEDIDVAIGKGFESAKLTKSITQAEDTKVITITATYGIFTYSCEIECTSVERPAELELIKCELIEKELVFEGRLTKNGIPDSGNLTIIAYKNGSEAIGADTKYFGKIRLNENGEFSGKASIHDYELSDLIYEMDVVFDAEELTEPYCVTVQYTNKTQVIKSIENLKKSSLDVFEYIISEDEGEGISNTENQKLFGGVGVWADDYMKLSQTDKDEVNELAEPYRSSLSYDNIAKILNASIIAATVTDMTDDKAVETLTLYNDTIEEIEVEGKTYSELTNSSKKWVAGNLKDNNKKSFESYEELTDEVRCSMLLDLISSTSYTRLADLFLNNTDILGDELTDLKNEDDTTIRDAAMKQVKLANDKSGYENTDDLIKDIKNAVSTAQKDDIDNSDSKPSGGSGGGGGGGSFSVGGIKDKEEKPEEDTPQIKPEEDIFVDLNGYEWAEDAIMNLYDKGIVSGVSESAFEPGREVTREEFVKLICEAFDFGKAETNNKFKDVPRDSWYAGYVAKATELGIVKGISEDEFGTGSLITREDMAVMIYRATEYSGKELDNKKGIFADMDVISDYAVSAIEVLSGNGIINGVGDNKFAPKANATRAEAAVIINRCL